jgi:hypothetical protein
MARLVELLAGGDETVDVAIEDRELAGDVTREEMLDGGLIGDVSGSRSGLPRVSTVASRPRFSKM